MKYMKISSKKLNFIHQQEHTKLQGSCYQLPSFSLASLYGVHYINSVPTPSGFQMGSANGELWQEA